MNLSRALTILVALGVPVAAGGMYMLSKSSGSCGTYRSTAVKKPTSCACCCETPEAGEFVSTQPGGSPSRGSDCVMFGGTPQRNMANLVDTNIPTDWSVEEGKERNLKWKAILGKNAYGGPVIAGGKIYIGTTNDSPRDPKIDDIRAVLMAFNEADGKFLWQILHTTPPDELFKQGLSSGLCSTPIVEGDGIFYVTPACEVIRANPEGRIVWKYDMMKELGVVPFHLANCSPLIVGDLLMICTSNGTDEQGEVAAPKAPSFIAVNKTTGKLAWQNSLPGANIIDGQWSNPTVATVAGKSQVIFAGGDGVIYSFDPEAGKLIWKFDCHPVRPVNPKESNYFVATPVVHGDRLYVGMGVGPELGKTPKSSYLLCIDVTKSGDVGPKSLDAKDPANKGSALVWSFGGLIVPRPKLGGGRAAYFTPTISTCAVHDGLVYAAEEAGYLSCFDAKTGERYWIDDLKSGIWGSPYYVDGKVLIGNEDGSIVIYKHGKKKEVINTLELGETVHSTPVVANGVLYLTTRSKLFAIVEKK